MNSVTFYLFKTWNACHGQISILYDNIRTFFPDQPYADVIKSPRYREMFFFKWWTFEERSDFSNNLLL